MSAYVIFIRKNIKNPEELKVYAELARAARADFTIQPISFYGKTIALENIECESVAILKFQSMQDAKDWYNSDAYQRAKMHRDKSGEYMVLITEGFML